MASPFRQADSLSPAAALQKQRQRRAKNSSVAEMNCRNEKWQRCKWFCHLLRRDDAENGSDTISGADSERSNFVSAIQD